MSEVPEIEVHMIKSTDKIGGIGEPGSRPWPRLWPTLSLMRPGSVIRRIPLTPTRVLEALKKV